MTPERCFFITPETNLEITNEPRKLMSTTVSHISSGNSSRSTAAPWSTPATWISTSMPPSQVSAAATAPATAVSSRTSTCQYRASPPASLISPVVVAPSASLTSKAATFAPLAETRSAVERPMPVAAPVTIIRLPVRSAAICYLLEYVLLLRPSGPGEMVRQYLCS